MTPLRIEAVYERVPQGTQPPAVRWGFRASLDRETSSAGTADDVAPDASGAAFDETARRTRALTAPAPRTVRGPRRGPREAGEESARPFPELLAYGPRGVAIPLVSAGGGGAGLGTRLDVFA